MIFNGLCKGAYFGHRLPLPLLVHWFYRDDLLGDLCSRFSSFPRSAGGRSGSTSFFLPKLNQNHFLDPFGFLGGGFLICLINRNLPLSCGASDLDDDKFMPTPSPIPKPPTTSSQNVGDFAISDRTYSPTRRIPKSIKKVPTRFIDQSMTMLTTPGFMIFVSRAASIFPGWVSRSDPSRVNRNIQAASHPARIHFLYRRLL